MDELLKEIMEHQKKCQYMTGVPNVQCTYVVTIPYTFWENNTGKNK